MAQKRAKNPEPAAQPVRYVVRERFAIRHYPQQRERLTAAEIANPTKSALDFSQTVALPVEALRWSGCSRICRLANVDGLERSVKKSIFFLLGHPIVLCPMFFFIRSNAL
jgi:hypothetical protein